MSTADKGTLLYCLIKLRTFNSYVNYITKQRLKEQ